MTERVLAADGMDAYQPTIALLETRQLIVIDGVPADGDHTGALIDAIDQRGLSQANFAFGVRTNANITIGLSIDGHCKFGLISGDANSLGFEPIPAPPWWPVKIDPDASQGFE